MSAPSVHAKSYSRVGTVGAARYLLLSQSFETLGIKFEGDHSVKNYLLHLSNEKIWHNYRDDVKKRVETTEKEIKEIEHVPEQEVRYSELKQKLKLAQQHQHNCQEIDKLIANGDLQERLAVAAEIARYYPHYMELTQQIAENRKR